MKENNGTSNTGAFYPILLAVDQTKCVIIGGGEVGSRKAAALVEAGACHVVVISPQGTQKLHIMARNGSLQWKQKKFSADDLIGAALVFAAADDPKVNMEVYCALSPGQWINMADRPDLSTFTVPAHFRRGKLTIAVSTGGASPGLARKIKQTLERQFGDEFERYIAFLEECRADVLARVGNPGVRRRIFQRLLDERFLDSFRAGDEDKIEAMLRRILDEET
ncbi:NAD(P)-dependent oxidoreductase [Aneurinibacillus sp. Ricciae_BoGa-3]|uniref:precorrin-2 dehydrogenase/sirohydrochlorin ferrochelatase family protein n=1 Tax=Aneurinibacillus sp. Ricciae_BoGa-3 TaxID=3022697 RepID=UPI0023420563|nr:NAD(P)-dependent oxidoreductase [Aneurinibacillus sp. Ricciae_BoGa-3]WCK53993.1 NAD(P)-dependent oxidoreductase [Aneurinibacillus sp. Ricciae_BoGa-3]